MIPSHEPTTYDENTPLLLGPNALKEVTIYIYLVACTSAVGGFLFGYDTGIISGAMIFIRDVFNLNEWWQEAIVSSTLLAAWMFSILSGSANDRFGRKPVIIGSSLIFVTGSLLMGFAWDEYILLAGRLVVGAGVGLASMTAPMYIAEVAPSSIRGQLVMINMCCITGGQFLASVIAYWLSFIKSGEGWRFMLGFAAIPAAIQFFAFLFMPESPRWLIGKKRYEDAKRVLIKIRPKDSDIEAEFNAIKENHLQARRLQAAQNDPNQSTFKRILENPPVRKALVLGCLLQLVQQLSGINTVMYYSASIFEMSGVYSKQKALILSAGTSLVNFVFTIVGFYLVERAGRRKLTLFSLFGVVVSLSILAAGFQFAYYNSPEVTIIEQSIFNHPCDMPKDCSACSRLPECGFCFTSDPDTDIVTSGSCLHVNTSHHDRSMLGKCIDGSTDDEMWAVEWCPSAYSWVTLLGMVLYLLFFAPGMGPMPWTINSEIYPSWARSWCLSAATSVNWLANLLMSMTFLSLTRLITKHGAFYLYALLASIGFVYFVLVLPETRGKTLEDLEGLFATNSEPKKNQRSNSNKTKAQMGAYKSLLQTKLIALLIISYLDLASLCRIDPDILRAYTRDAIDQWLDADKLNSIYWEYEPLDASLLGRATGINVSLAETHFNYFRFSSDESEHAANESSTEPLLRDTFVTCTINRDRSHSLSINLELSNPFDVIDVYFDINTTQDSSSRFGLFRVHLSQSTFLVHLSQRIRYDECLAIDYVQLAPNVDYNIECVECDEKQRTFLDNMFSKRRTQLDVELDSLLSEKLTLGLKLLFNQQRFDLDMLTEHNA